MKDFKAFLKERTVVFDGALGTMLQKKIGNAGTLPERLNAERPELLKEIHRAYAAAGADVISANTFGANEYKAGSRELSDKLIRAGIEVARRAAPDKFIALDLGPVGKLIEPTGDMTFEEAYEIYAHAIEAGRNADLILLETMTDLRELKAALLAAREHSDLPVIASMTFGAGGRTFMGCPPSAFALTAAPLADAIGVNCSLGPEQLLPVMQEIMKFSPKPVIVQANAGLPDNRGNYGVSADEFAEAYKEFLRLGARIVGGCCGTTPAYIEKIRKLVDSHTPFERPYRPISAVCSARKTVVIDGVKVIGERINPTGKEEMKAALLVRDTDYIAEMALEQAEAGADILDVNAGLPEINEAETLCELVRSVQSVTDLPLQLDSCNAIAMERALRAYCGKAIINSVNGDEKVLDTLLPLAAKYGAAIVGLTMDERGIPETRAARLAVAEKIIERAAAYGIPEEDIYIDCLTLTAGAAQAQATETLAALAEIKKRHRVKTVLGISNISFGLPNRRILNTAFLTAALFAGLDLPILNPNAPENMQAIAAYRVLSGTDSDCAAYLALYGTPQNSAPKP